MKRSDGQPKVEEPGATNPQFPYSMESPNLEITTVEICPPARPGAITIRLAEKIKRVSILFRDGKNLGLPLLDLNMSSETAAELGEQLLYARDKLTGRR